ncbi:unnamed protein product [Orchesella dallaii]|uniref:Uncharacterized protein n=1 Tax=Orchesella dallaii TaxID=48710 RepID=A0ABP1RKJ3_9HEXA
MDTEGTEGGTGPSQINVRLFVAARVAEIATLTTKIANTRDPRISKGFSFQHVAKHMRRRAVSHQPKRLPTRLRAGHLSQVKKSSGSVKKVNKPSRFHRKRPEVSILEYNYRQLRSPDKPRWLESHVWHAKRFHMIPLWGMMIPRAPTSKSFKALYNASNNNAIMQDLSYLRCLMLTGNSKSEVLSGISKLITTDYNPSDIRRGELLSGRELVGVVTSVADNTPSKYLGSIRYQLVTPTLEGGEFKLILWCHPIMQSELIDELRSVYNMEDEEEDEDSSGKVTGMEHDLNQDETKFLWKLINSRKWLNEETGVVMKDMSEFYNRIRITGPKSLAILKEIIEISHQPNAHPQSKENQEKIWNSLETVTAAPNNMTLVLDVVDPRLKLQKVRRGVRFSSKTASGEPALSSTSSMGADSVWSEGAIRCMLRTKMSDKDVSERRRKNLIPGTSIADDMTPNVVSLSLVFRTDQNAGNTGIDIIVPVGWMMPIWISMNFCAVRAYGLEFEEYLTFEMESFNGFTSSTYLPPDISTFSASNSSHHDAKKAKYFSYAPDKRSNLIKLGCAFPFSVDWERFLKFTFNLGIDAAVDVKIVRKREDLLELSNYFFSKRKKRETVELNIADTFLVPVKLYLVNGCVSDGGCICLPTEEDYGSVGSVRWRDTVNVHQDPLEDIHEAKRHDLRNKHQKKLAKLAKKRKSARKASRFADDNDKLSFETRLKELDSQVSVEAYNNQMNQLWVNENVEEVLAKQTREVMGFVSYSHFSYKFGQSAALGYVTLRQMKNVKFVKDQMLVLVRDWSRTLEYRWANLVPCLPSRYE